ncbi:MAG: NINE protein [Collinsella intestinalis]|uniref:TM2 domain protein n=1 Tax=Collinsella intestinalis TaxID=147207 RepID=A0A6N3CND6_9ACTN
MQGYEEIKELKQLLDEGLITQEDFDQKKTELLNAASMDAAEAPIDSTPASYLSNSRTEKKKSKWVAGLTAIFLGCYGVHKFYLGYSAQGAILLAVTLGLALPASFIARALGGIALMKLIGILQFIPILIGVAEGVIYLIKSEEDFQMTYVAGRREWF